MQEAFSRALKLLRKEKGVSQRVAASRLNISQALLSHYENGAREPGLEFLARACDYYEVSADYLIGRTMVRDGAAFQPESLYDAAGEKDNRLRGSASAMVSRRLMGNCVSLMFDLLGRSGHPGLTLAVMRYLSAAYYKAFRLLYSVCGRNANDFFSVPERLYATASELEMADAELHLRSILTGAGWPGSGSEAPPVLPEISHESLTKDYPMLMPSLLNVLHQVGDRIKKRHSV